MIWLVSLNFAFSLVLCVKTRTATKHKPGTTRPYVACTANSKLNQSDVAQILDLEFEARTGLHWFRCNKGRRAAKIMDAYLCFKDPRHVSHLLVSRAPFELQCNRQTGKSTVCKSLVSGVLNTQCSFVMFLLSGALWSKVDSFRWKKRKNSLTKALR